MEVDTQSLPISAFQHLLFCERQCALIHIDQAWAENRENRFTAEGPRSSQSYIFSLAGGFLQRTVIFLEDFQPIL